MIHALMFNCRYNNKSYLRLYFELRRIHLVQQFVLRMRAIIELRRRDLIVRRDRAVITVQRFLRGCRGRLRSARMRQMWGSMGMLGKLVSVENFPLRLLDDLAHEIESYKTTRNSMLPPLALISLLRCLHCLFYADSPQRVSVFRFEKLTTIDLHASELGWEDAARVLRRKSVFIRKLRGLINRLSPPNLRKLDLSTPCLQLLEEINQSISARDFDGMNAGRTTALKLLEYAKHIRMVALAQSDFPEAFNSALPSWTIAFRQRRLRLEKTCCHLLSLQESIRHLSQMKEDRYNDGIHFGLLAEAIQQQRADLKAALSARATLEKAFSAHREELLSSRRRRGESMEHEVRAKHLAFDIASRLHAEYLENAKVIVEAKARRLGEEALQTQLTLLQAESAAEVARLILKEDFEYISSEEYFCYQLLNQPESVAQSEDIVRHVKEMGTVLGELRLLTLEWRDFIHNFGGVQFVDNANENESLEYQRMQRQARYLLGRKSELHLALNKDMEVNVSDKVEDFRAKRERILNSHQWESCTPQELEFEMKEDIDCAVKESQYGSVTGESVTSNHALANNAEYSKSPMLLIADVAIINEDRSFLSFLNEFSISTIEIPSDAQGSIDGHTSQLVLNTIIQKGSAVIFLDLASVRRVIERVFMAIRVLISALDPAPKVTLINGKEPHGHTSHPSHCVVTTLRSQLWTLAHVIDNEHLAEPLLSEVHAAVHSQTPNFFAEVAAVISALLGYWTPSPLDWPPQDIFKGCLELISHFPNASQLPSSFYVLDFGKWDYVSYSRLLPALKLLALSGVDLNSSHPSLYWMSTWAIKAIELLNEYCTFPYQPCPHLHFHRVVLQGGEIHLASYCLDNDFSYLEYEDNEDFKSKFIERCLLHRHIHTEKSAQVRVITNQSLESFTQNCFNIAILPSKVSLYSHGKSFVIFRVENELGVSHTKFDMNDYQSYYELNNTEIKQGRQVPKAANNDDWKKILCMWVHISRSVSGVIQSVDVYRTRCVVHMRHTIISGYACYVHVFEERKDCYVIEIRSSEFGDKALQFEVAPSFFGEFLTRCDPMEAISVKNGESIPCILCDRLIITPYYNLRHFAERGQALKLPSLRIRCSSGPGRLLGRRLVKVDTLGVILTLFELTNDEDVFPVRMCVYDPASSNQTEYRLSPTERELLLFTSPQIYFMDSVASRLRLFGSPQLQKLGVLSQYGLNLGRGSDKYLIFDRSVAKVKRLDLEIGISLSFVRWGFQLLVIRRSELLIFQIDNDSIDQLPSEKVLDRARAEIDAVSAQRQAVSILQEMRVDQMGADFYTIVIGRSIIRADFDNNAPPALDPTTVDPTPLKSMDEPSSSSPRNCWRGLLDCKKFDLGTLNRPELFSRREHRLYRFPSIAEAGAVTSIQYFNEHINSKDLVVVMQEFLNAGLCLVKKKYCLGLYTHYGLLISTAIIEGDEELNSIVGRKYAGKLNAVNFDVCHLFSYLVNEKVQLFVEKDFIEGQGLRQLQSCLKIRFVREVSAAGSALNSKVVQRKAVTIRGPSNSHTLIIHIEMKRSIGIYFKIIVMLSASDKDIFYDHHRFFSCRRFRRDQLERLTVIFQFLDLRNKRSAYSHLVLAESMHLVDDYFQGNVNLSSATRRSKFAQYLLGHIKVFYQEDGTVGLSLLE